MVADKRLSTELIARLDEKFQKASPLKPTFIEQSLADRVRRSLSWIRRALSVSQDNAPPRFVELWIALNALYGRPPYEEGFKPDDRQDFLHFMRLLCSIDKPVGELQLLMKRIERRAYGLIGNKHLWKEFWRRDGVGWKKKSKQKRKDCQEVLEQENPVQFFSFLFERLLELRNQIFHGSCSENTTKNRDALMPALIVLEDMLAVFLGLMIQHGTAKEWPLVPYPGYETPQYPG